MYPSIHFPKNIYNLDLTKIFDELRPYKYVVVKVEVPYMPKYFPIIYPIGKDLDIFSTREDFHKVNKVLLDFSKKYNNVFSIKTIEEVKNFRIRMEKYNQLYYQLDNSVNDEELPTFL